MSDIKFTPEFIKQLRERIAVSDVPWYLAIEYLSTALDEIEQLKVELAALKEAARWIPVSERLPEDYTDVLVLWHWDSRPESLVYDITRKWTDEKSLIVHDGDYDKNIVYWQPLPGLPQPPEPEQDEEEK